MCQPESGKSNIFLIGFMGAGKSAVAEYMRTLFNMDSIEMDEIISKREGMTIPKIFESHGEAYFRELETKLILDLQNHKNTVVSCGGGVPMREQNVIEMRKSGVIVLLTASPQTILKRVKYDNSRPLLENRKTVEAISELMEKRREKYHKAADITIATDGKSPKEICKEIVHKVGLCPNPPRALPQDPTAF